MAVPAGSQFGIRFVDQSKFDEMVSERTLTPGFWYFINGDRLFHIAFSQDTYRTQGGVSVQELVDELLQHIEIDSDYLYQMITNEIPVNQNFIESLANYIILDDSDNSVTWQIANYILQDETVMQNITHELQQILNTIVTSVASINAPDGSVLATNDDGVFTLPLATNETYGIVKGQENTTPETWNNVSVAPDGTMSVNRELLEEKIGQGGGSGGVDKWDKMVAEPDKSVIAKIENRELIVQATSPHQYGVVECGKDCVCYRKPLGLKSMDGMLVAVLKHDEHLFYPMVFTDRVPPRLKLFDKLTFIAPGSGTSGGGGSGSNPGGGSSGTSTKDFAQDFSAHAYIPNSTGDFIQDFPVSVLDPAKDFIQDFAVNAYVPDSLQDVIQDFPVSAYIPNPLQDFIQDFAVNTYVPDSLSDFTQDFNVYVPDPAIDFIQDFPVNTYVPDPVKDFMQDFAIEILPTLQGYYEFAASISGMWGSQNSEFIFLTDSEARETWKVEIYLDSLIPEVLYLVPPETLPYNLSSETHNLSYVSGPINVFCSNSAKTKIFSVTMPAPVIPLGESVMTVLLRKI